MKKQVQMDWPAILAEVHRRGMTLTELAKRKGLSASSCRKVKTLTNYKAQEAIANFIDQKPEDLWPSRYPKGKPRILDTAKYPPSERKNSNAVTDKKVAA